MFTGSPLRVVRRLNDAMKRRSRALLTSHRDARVGDVTGSCEFNVTLINLMEPERKESVALKDEGQFGMGKASVSWHSDSSLRDLYPRNQVCIRLAAASSDSSSASRRSSRRSGRLSPTFGSSASSSSESVRSSPRDAASSAASALDTMGEPLRLRLALFALCDGGEGWVSASSRLAALG